jgi:hypothetical protein
MAVGAEPLSSSVVIASDHFVIDDSCCGLSFGGSRTVTASRSTSSSGSASTGPSSSPAVASALR